MDDVGLVVRQPAHSHSASAQNLSERVTAEESLSADKLTLCHLRRAAGSLSAHALKIFLEERAIKPKTANLKFWPRSYDELDFPSESPAAFALPAIFFGRDCWGESAGRRGRLAGNERRAPHPSRDLFGRASYRQ